MVFVCLMLCLMDFNTCNPEFTGFLIFGVFCCFFQNLLSHYHSKQEITVISFFTKKMHGLYRVCLQGTTSWLFITSFFIT